MRQYICRPWIIAINVWTATAFGAFAAQSAPDMAKLPDYLWYREASARAIAHESEPPADLTAVTFQNNTLTGQLHVKPWFDKSSLSYVIAAPDGEITTAAMTIREVTDSAASEDDSGTSRVRESRTV